MNIHEDQNQNGTRLWDSRSTPAVTVTTATVDEPTEDETDADSDGFEKSLVCYVQLNYLGFVLVDWRLTKAVLNWIIGDRLLSRRHRQPVNLLCHDNYFRAEDGQDGEPVFVHPISEIYQFTRGRDGLALAYITHNQQRDRFYCHAFSAPSHDTIATVHDAWTQSKDCVKTNPKTMDLLSLLPSEKQGLLTLSTAFQIEEDSFNVRYLGQMSTTASTGSSGLVDKVIEAAMQKQKEQQRKRQQVIKEGRLQQSRRDMMQQRQNSKEEEVMNGIDGVVSDGVAIAAAKVKELQDAVVPAKKEPGDGDTKEGRAQSGSAKSRFFNLIRRSGSGSAVHVGQAPSTAADSATTATSQKTEDHSRHGEAQSSVTPSSEGRSTPVSRQDSDDTSCASPDLRPARNDGVRGSSENLDARDAPKCSSRSSNGTESTLTASAGPPGADSGDSGVSAASTPDGDNRHFSRETSAPALSESNISVFSSGTDVQSFSLNHRLVNLCISAESIRFYDLKHPKARTAVTEDTCEDSSKQLCWERKLSSVSFCAKGHIHNTCWCLIVSESSSSAPGSGKSNGGFVCYLFSSPTEEMTVSVMEALTKSFKVAFELHRNPPVTIRSPFCESCPLYAMHKLCTLVNSAMNAKTAQAFTVKTIEGLPKDERTWLLERQQQTQQFSEEVQLQVTMGLLRGILERLQSEHSHQDGEKPMEIDDNDDSTSKPRLGALSRAKRTLANSIEGLRKKDKTASPAALRANKTDNPGSGRRRTVGGDNELDAVKDAPQRNSLPAVFSPPQSPNRSRSPALASPPGTPTLAVPVHTPPSLRRRVPQRNRKTSFRHSIYKTAHATPGGGALSPSKESTLEDSDDDDENTALLLTPRRQHPGSASARGLWKRAIDEQVMLVKLEKASMQEYDKEELTRRRLTYIDALDQSQQEELCPAWEQLLQKLDNDQFTGNKADVRKRVGEGIPKHLRGRAWTLLAAIRFSSKSRRLEVGTAGEGDNTNNTPAKLKSRFQELKSRTTSFLHAILIDLARTFPGHEYFQSIVGPGQCSLFNVLRAYANVDEDVGYCQGLSFVAGLLIMHADSDEETFSFLHSLMYGVGLRDQYKPDMARLQVHLYQLSRLLHDLQPKLHELFEKHDVAPFFYAAPWFLTLFSSQFTLYFASRAMDLIFMDGVDAVFKISVTLLRLAEDELLQCTNFEQILEGMKNILPAIGARVPDTIIRQAMQLDIHDKLRTFEVEHSVLQDLDSSQTMSGDLEAANIALKAQNTDLIQQLALARGSALRLQDTVNDLSVENDQLAREVDRYAAQTADLRRTVHELRLQVVDLKAGSQGTTSTDEVEGSTPPSYLSGTSLERKPIRNSGLRRRSSVPALRLGRPIVERRHQWSFENLAESPRLQLEEFLDDTKLSSAGRTAEL